MHKLCLPVCAGILLGAASPSSSPQTPGEIVAYAGTGVEGYSGAGGPATSANLYQTFGVALDKAGNLYIADRGADCIWKVTASTGIITTVAGQCGYLGFSGDGGLAVNAELASPNNIAFDPSGNLYIADLQNQRVRRVEATTGIITTVAGNGDDAYLGDGGAAASAAINFPAFIAVDPSGDLYIGDYLDNVIRKVTATTGIISTVVGNHNQGYSGDGGPALNAQLFSPFGLAFDSAGDLFFSDQNGSVIREVHTSTGIITTLAGNGMTGYSGDGGPAKNASLNFAQDITVDRFGNLFIVDQQNDRIRKVAAATQVITTVAGASIFDTPVRGNLAVDALLTNLFGIAVDGSDNLYVSVVSSQVFKVFAGGPAQSTLALTAPKSTFPVGQIFDITATVTGPLTSTPTGTVTIYSGGVVVDTVQLNSSGQHTYSLSLPSVSEYSYYATYSGDRNYAPSGSNTLFLGAATLTAPAPYFGPESGTYSYNLQVSIYDSVPGLTMFYTTDGSTPSSTHGRQYLGAITVTADATIKAVAVDTKDLTYADSPVSSSSYVINLPYEAPLAQGEWSWQNGGPASTGGVGGCSHISGHLAVYGTLGVAAPDNLPGVRTPAAQWTDKSGNFWLFGGETVTPQSSGSGGCGAASDVWMFNPTTNEWTWMGGPANQLDQKGVYGTLGKFAPGNTPGGRQGSMAWTDKSGNFWLFGGLGYDLTGTFGDFNDLWEFNPTIHQWSWIAGSQYINQSGAYGTLHVAKSGNTPGGRDSGYAWTDLNGNLWMFGGSGYDSADKQGNLNDLWEFHPSTRQWAWMGGAYLVNQPGVYGTHKVPSPNNIPGARSGGMVWVDKLGKFWLFGGFGLGGTTTGEALNDTWEFNPSSLNWTWAMGSSYGGTYSGSGYPGQVGVYGTLGVPDPGNTPGGRGAAITFTDSNGNLWMYGGYGFDSAGNYGNLDDLWEFDRATWLWAWMGGHELSEGVYGVVTYGPYREASSQTELGPRSGAAGWTDTSGNLWLFGGSLNSAPSYVTLSNDLFKYQKP